MSEQIYLKERLRNVFATPNRGVIGLVDHLLELSRGRWLKLDWHQGACNVSIRGGSEPDGMELPIPKSTMRAVLARVAALCNERIPNSVSPYGGKGELALGPDPTGVIQINFVNTPEEHLLELTSVPLGPPQQNGVQQVDVSTIT